MATRFVVTQIKPCPKCKGQRFVETSIWTAYWEWFDAFIKSHNGRSPDHEEDGIWWADCGEYDQNALPSPEMECPECGAVGELRQDVDLFTALKAYKEMDTCAASISEEPCTCGWH